MYLFLTASMCDKIFSKTLLSNFFIFKVLSYALRTAAILANRIRRLQLHLSSYTELSSFAILKLFTFFLFFRVDKTES